MVTTDGIGTDTDGTLLLAIDFPNGFAEITTDEAEDLYCALGDECADDFHSDVWTTVWTDDTVLLSFGTPETTARITRAEADELREAIVFELYRVNR